MASLRGAKQRAQEVVRRLGEEYPDARCALHHANAYELLVATILSAQCTDARVNMVTPALFDTYPTPADLAHADPMVLEEMIRSTGFFRSKAKSLLGMAHGVEERFAGEIPTDLDDLVTLPGVGRKTGNVVRSVAYGLPGLPVDTHVGRLARRLRLTDHDDADRVELDLNAFVEPEQRGDLSLRLIEHGRKVCIARRPRCDECVLVDVCPSAFKVNHVPAKTATKPKATKVVAAKAKTAANLKATKTSSVSRGASRSS